MTLEEMLKVRDMIESICFHTIDNIILISRHDGLDYEIDQLLSGKTKMVMNIKYDRKAESFYCVWCSLRKYISVMFKTTTSAVEIIRYKDIPINPRSESDLEFIYNADRNIIGMQCPTCKRKVIFS